MVDAAASTSSVGATTTTQQPPSQGGHTYALSAKMRKMIQSIKEVVTPNFSDADIYIALKECNMDPYDTIQKLLSQDPFHEVKRRRDKRKESMGYRGSVDSRKNAENSGQGMKLRSFPDRNPRRGGYARSSTPGNAGVSREFRVVRDNRVNGNTNRELKPVLQQGLLSANDQVSAVTEKGLTGTSNDFTSSGVRISSQASNGPTDSLPRHTRDANSGVGDRKVAVEHKRATTPNTASRVQPAKSNNSHHQSAALASSNAVVGLYSSSTDPVHVPSPDSRSPAAIGAIKREVGVVGGRRLSSDNAGKDSSASNNSFSNSVLGRNVSLSDPFRPFPAISKGDQVNVNATDSAVPSISGNRSFLSNQYNNRPHQVVGHQKASQLNKEWKPKSSQKSSVFGPGVIGTPAKPTPSPADTSKALESDATDLQDKIAQVNIHENQNVIIAQHIRVPETDRCRLTFGSFGVEFDSSRNFASGFQAVGVVEETNGESAASLSASVPELSSDDASGSKQADLLDDQVRNSGSDSTVSGEGSEHQLPEKSSSPPNLDNYADIGLVRDNSPSYAPSDSQQQQEPPELPNFSGYDPQTGYDISYFRPTIDETVRGQGLPSPQEHLASHMANSIPASTIPMVQQQQQPPMAQMYPQVHVSHFANMMPFRQFISPVYVPQMAMPGYSSNPAYPHPSNGSSYLLMPPGSSHLSANGLKYGIQQYKPVPGNNPTGFGNFTNPTGYAINASGVVGSATGLDDSSRIKYKDGNLFVPNPQAETSEIWVQNPREHPGLQSAPYYNIPGQTPHAAYLPSHTGHASFNAAAAQSSHMQFSGLYPPPPQPGAMASPHHLGPVMGGNVGVGVTPAAPGAQVGAYQQPQLGHLNWNPPF